MNEGREADRAERLKAALRDNLRRRKAQARGRSEGEGDTVTGTTPAAGSEPVPKPADEPGARPPDET